MIFSIIVSSALCDKEYDQRAEQKDTDSERSDGQQNAGGDDAVTAVGERNAVTRVSKSDSAGICTVYRTAVVNDMGSCVVLRVLADGADRSRVQTQNLKVAAICQVKSTGISAVGSDRDGGRVSGDVGCFDRIGTGDSVSDVQRKGKALVLITLVTGDCFAEIKIILSNGVGITVALYVGIGGVSAVGTDRGRGVTQDVAVYGKRVGIGISDNKNVEITRGGVIGDAGLTAVGLVDHVSVYAGLGEGIRREGYGNALLGIFLAGCGGAALRVCRQTRDGVGSVGVAECGVADRCADVAGEDLNCAGGCRGSCTSGDGVGKGDIGDIRVFSYNKVLNESRAAADRRVGCSCGCGNDGE